MPDCCPFKRLNNGIGERSQKSNKMASEEEAPAATIRTAGALRPERALTALGSPDRN